MTKQLRKVFSILCAIVLLISSLSMALAEETVPAADDAARIAAEEAAARKAEEEAARKAAEEAARKKAEEEAARKAAEEEAARKKAEEEAARKAAEEEAARKAAEEEAARRAAEEEAARKAAEEEAARKAAEEEAARIAAEQQAAEAQAAAEQPAAEQPSDEVPAEEESDDGTVEIDDDWGSIDPEVISENTPEITDELKGLRTAELSVGQSISDTIDFGEQLTVTLKKSDADSVVLKLYTNASIKTTVDGKAAGFTPADSDDPSRKLYVFELANAGRSHEIVLTADDTASFKLAAVEKQAAGTQEEAPADNGNGTPAEGSTGSGKPAANKPDTTPAPTVQASVKTYDALKVGSRISDSLIVGQKAKIQVKCGKNPFVTLTLKANPDDVKVSADGAEVRFTSAGNGTYTAELENVAFRKFTIVISSRKEISFTLSAEANKAAAEAAEKAEEEKAVEEAVKNNKEETEQPAEEPAAEEKAEEAAETEIVNKEEKEEQAAEKNGEQTEVSEEEKAEEPEAPAEEAVEDKEAAEETEAPAEEEKAEETEAVEGEENGEEAEAPAEGENAEENQEEENPEEAEEPSEETEAPAEDAEGEEENSEEEAAPAYTKVTVTAEEGADLYAEASRESEVTGHLEAGAEALVVLNEDQTWGQIFTEDEEAAAQFIAMEDVSVNADAPEEEKPAEEEPAEETSEEAAPEYTRIVVTAEEGADLYAEASRESEVTGHLETGAEALVVLNEDQTWGQIVSEDEEAAAQFISMEDAEVKTEAEEPEEEETKKPEELGYIRVIVTDEEGADLYAEASRESEVTGHLEASAEAWVLLNEEQTWGQLYSEDEEAAAQFLCMEDAENAAKKEFEDKLTELGYRKVTVLNRDGADIYDSTEEEAAVIGHADYETELWIKDAEAEGWAEIYTEEEIQQFVKTADLERQMFSDEEMLEMGYIKAVVATDIGANVYGSVDGDDVVDHLDAGTELWVTLIEGAARAQIFDLDETAPARYINLVDIIATKKPEGMGDLPTRELVIHSSADGLPFIVAGSTVTFTTELINFMEDDVYTVQWKYSEDGEKYKEIAGANGLNYEFVVDMTNAAYSWKVSVILITPETEEAPALDAESAQTPEAEDVPVPEAEEAQAPEAED